MHYLLITSLFLTLLGLFAGRNHQPGRLGSSIFSLYTRLLLVCTGLLVAGNSIAAPDLQGGTATAEPGQEVFIPVNFVADGSVVALQFDLIFNSTTLSIANMSSGSALVDHVFDWQLVAPGNVRVVITTTALERLNSGSLANIIFRIDDAALEGTEPLILQNLVLADSSALSVSPTDVQNGSITIRAPVVIGDEDAVPIPATTVLALALMIVLLGLTGYIYIKRGPRGITLSLVLGVTLFSSTIVRAVLFPGDANGDGMVDLADIPVIVTQILEISIAPGDPDCNQDSMVDVLDTICVAQPPAENRPPVLALIEDQAAEAGQNFGVTVIANDPDVDDILTYSFDVFPVGMSINPANGLIAWVPSVAQLGANSVTVRATDQGGLFDTESFQVSVFQIDGNQPPDLIPPGNRVIQADIIFTTLLFATDPDVGDVLTFGLSSPPAGMSIEASTGMLSWSPATDDLGINPVIATVMDAEGLLDTESFSIEVIQQIVTAETNTPPRLTVPQDQTIVFGNLLDLSATATDADVDDTLTFALVNAPEGMVIDAVTGAITWTPLEAQIGQLDVSVKVSDAAGAADFGSFIVTVLNVNRPPVAVDEVYQARIGETLNVAVPGVLGNDSDPDDDLLTAALVSSPANGELDFRADGSFDYTPGLPEIGPGDIELEQYCLTPKMDAIANVGVFGQLAVGDVDNDGVSEIVGMVNAKLFVMNAETCEFEYQMDQDDVNDDGLFPSGGAHIGLVDLDGDGDLEIVVKTGFTSSDPFFFGQDVSGHLIAYHHDGAFVWSRGVAPGEDSRFGNITPLIRNPDQPTAPIGDWRNAGPTFADLDADGQPEIVIGFFHDDTSTGAAGVGIPGVVAFNGNDGSIKWLYFGEPTGDLFTAARYSMVHVADLDLDDSPEVIYESYVLDHNGNLEHTMPLDDLSFSTIPSHVESAVANFDNDGFAEILIRHKQYFYMFEHDGTRKWKQKFTDSPSVENSIDRITVADFDGDGELEFTHRMIERSNENFVGFARYQVVYDNDGTVLWSHEANPEYYSNSVRRPQAVTAFDADQDGAYDIIANLRIDALTDDPALGLGNSVLMAFSGKDGAELFRARAYADSANSVFPVIVDLDDDGEAEILVSGTHPLNTFGSSYPSFFIYRGKSSSPLPPAPAISNQWSFNAAYVNDDGSIPANPVPHWLIPGQNGFHQVSSPDKVYTQLKCEGLRSDQLFHNGTLAVGDVDNDGTIEILGTNYISDFLKLEVWIMNGEDCTRQPLANVQDSIDAGGFSQNSDLGLLDIDGDGDLEIIGTRSIDIDRPFTSGENLMAIHHDGSLAWPGDGASEDLSVVITGLFAQMGPTFADLDANGSIEIVMPWRTNSVVPGRVQTGITVFNSVDGTILWEFFGELEGGDADYKPPVVVDLDLDGTMEIIYHTNVVDHLGNQEFILPIQLAPGNVPTHLTMAVANFDDDPFPEIIGIDKVNHYLYNHDGTVIFQNPVNNNAGSQITVADFDGDNEVEYAWYNGLGSTLTRGYFQVYDTDGSLLWSHQGITKYGEELTRLKGVNATAFDANNDGAFDLVVHLNVYTPITEDVDGVYIFDGRDGSVLEFMQIGSNSAEQRFTTIADIDNDGEAEIISSRTNGLLLETRIWEGTQSHPLPQAPAHRNQWIFNEAYADEKGNALINTTPHWLQPGLNGYNMIKRPPDPLAGTTDSFTYKANDGEFDSDVATVTFDVQPDGTAPVFLSQPDTLTTVGFQYEYAPRVVDIDPGDSVSFILTAAPEGMTIDPSNGRVRWLPNIPGAYSVAILASDTIGFATPQSYILLVGEPVEVPDVIGQPEANAETTLTTANLLVGRKQTANHPTIPAGAVSSQTPIAGSVAEFGSEVDLILSLGPAPEDIDDDNDDFTENQGDCNDDDDSIKPGAVDPAGDGIDQDCDGIDGNQVLSKILVLPGDSTVLTNQPVNLSAIGIFEDGTSQNLTGIVGWTNGPSFNSAVAGSFTATASRDDVNGTATIEVVDRVVGDVIPPAVEITAPAANSSVIEPVDITGTATDANFLKYTIGIAPTGDTDFTEIANSTAQVTDDVLGRLDPTLLLNDVYTIRLTVFDAGGNQISVENTVQVDGNMKVGNFTTTFTDLQIPMSGIPITVNRTYDSRDKATGDFGIGWRLGFRDIQLRTSRVPGSAWVVIKSGLAYFLQPMDDHKVSLTMVNGRVEEFDLNITPNQSVIVPFPPVANRAVFVSRPGTQGKLESLDNNNLTILDSQPGDVQLLDDLTNSVYNPSRFRYTAADGTEVILHKRDGIESIRDNNGNTLTFTVNGIIHSAGKSVLFQRDPNGRITRVIDPEGNTQDYAYSDSGDLLTHSDAEGNTTRFLYNYQHGLIGVVDPLNRVVSRNEYDANGRLISSTGADGRVITYTHNIGSRQEVLTDGDGSITVLDYDEDGNILSMTDPLGNVSLYSYDADGNQISRTNPEGETTIQTFDTSGNMLTHTNPLGHMTTMSYDTSNRVTSSTDPMGRVTSMSYDSRGNLVETRNALGDIYQSSSFDARGNKVQTTNAAGNSTSYVYDAIGNLIERTDALGTITTFSYDANGRNTSKTDGLGKVTTSQYDVRGLKTASSDSLGRVTQFAYTVTDHLQGVTDPAGNSASQILDAEGQVTSEIDMLGNIVVNTYDFKGNLTSITDPLNQQTTLEYDVLGRRTKSISPGGSVTQVRYDSLGRIIERIDALGNSIHYEYDAAGRNTQVTDALGNATTYSYDPAGNQISMVDARGNLFSFEYDALNQRVKTIFPDGSFETTVYDKLGRVIAETNALGQLTSFEYDGNDNLTRLTDPAGQQTVYVYDAKDRMVSQTDARGNTTAFSYDDLGRQTSKVYADSSVELMGYDISGDMTQVTDPNGNQNNLAYDAKAQLLSRTFADGNQEVFTYNLIGQMLTSTNRWGTVNYDYDVDGRLIKIDNPDGSAIAYTHDAHGNRTSSVTWTSLLATPRTTSSTHDVLNHLSLVTDPDGNTTNYAYDEIGNLISISNPNGVLTSFAYDSLSRLSLIVHTSGGIEIARYQYAVNAVGDRTSVIFSDRSLVEYEYDNLRQLIRETHRDNLANITYEMQYSYDAVGNRISTTDKDAVILNYSYDSDDKLISAGSDYYAYDANGNLVARTDNFGTTLFGFDYEDQLQAATTPLSQVEYEYNANGDRVRRAEAGAGTGTNYLVDPFNPTGSSQVLVDYDDGATPLAEYVYGHKLLSQNRNGSQHYMQQDGSLNVRLLTDSAGIVTDTYSYQSFGVSTGQTGSTNNLYRFAGERQDPLTGLSYLRARFYDPSTGRFVSRDPFAGHLRDPRSLHRYLYAKNNPINYSDPNGTFSLPSVMVSMAISGTVSFSIAAISGKRGKELIYETIIGAAFGAIGGPLGKTLGTLFTESKVLITLIRNPVIGKYAARLAAAIPVTALDAAEDLSKALSNGDAFKDGFSSKFAQGVFLNLVFNVVLGPFSVDASEVNKLVKVSVPVNAKSMFNSYAWEAVPSGKFVADFIEKESDEALDLFVKFFWEFSKLMSEAIPKFIGRNE